MAKKADNSARATELLAQIARGELSRLYIFHGEERYMLEHCVAALRERVVPEGLDGFNYRRLEGASLSVNTLRDTAETFPVFADMTLIEVRDFDIFKRGEDDLASLAEMFADMPEYTCAVFIYDTVAFKPDKRLKAVSQLLKHAEVVEFERQEQSKLATWIRRHFKERGKTCDKDTAEYLAFMTGGLMTPLLTEIEKLAAYSKGVAVTRADIDAMVEPTVEAVAYNMTDALAERKFDRAAEVLADLLAMREPPQKLIYQFTLKARHLLAARLCVEQSLGTAELMSISGIRNDWQARNALNSARRMTFAQCRKWVLLCAETAYRLNSGGDSGDLVLLLTRLAAA
ncbi:MAG: DNA polymerase III subunit delta [Oscillospiraceae bacterium]|jgi:DNA polymerase-3 subunit delta|nr:DNA polymerase III subunit delta [Oscillospiraceae bacterium]